MVQSGGARFYPGHVNLLEPVVLLAAIAIVGGLLLAALQLLVTRSRRTLGNRRENRRQKHQAATAEVRARTMMSELCPHGWRAQINLAEGLDQTPVVELEWAEIDARTGLPAVTRRVSAPTIAGALEAMVADRRTDETLEHIEHGAVAEGASWPDS